MIKKLICAVLAACLCTLLASCGENITYSEHVSFAMDTYVTLRLPSDAASDTDALYAECDRLLAQLESELSAHDGASRLYDFNNGGDDISSSETELYSVISSACRVSDATNGAYRCTVGALSLLWNVTGGGPVPSEDDIALALEAIGTDGIELTPTSVHRARESCVLDLGGIAKGYAADRLCELLSSRGVPHGMVSVGGTVAVFGEKPNGESFRIGITDPRDTSAVACYLNIKSGTVSVSGSYERYFEQDGVKYHHILDPKTGRPSDTPLLSVAVWSPDGAVADALSTALFVLGEDGVRELYDSGELDFEAMLVSSEGELILTDGLSDGSFERADNSYTVRELRRPDAE